MPSRFTGPLTITELDADMSVWQLAEPLVYEVEQEGSGQVITVPKGFETDFASIPWPVYSFLPRWGRYGRAAVLHDFGYTLLDAGQPHALMPTRKAADDVFYEAMIVSGVWKVLAGAMWAAVRALGGSKLFRSWAVRTRSTKG